MTPTFSDSPTSSPSPTVTLTYTPGALLHGVVQVYNSAGERVAVLLQDLALYREPTSLAVLQAAFVPDAGGSGLLRLGGPEVTLAWDGRNLDGQLVASGAYQVSVQWTDSFGHTSSMQAALSVLRAPQGVDVAIFNSAGELVRSYALPSSSGGRLELSAAAFAVNDPAGLGIKVGTPGPGVVWDGRDARGRAVAGGSYVVQVTSKVGGQVRIESQSVQVLAAPGADPPSAYALPNPARAHDAFVDLRLGGPPSLWNAQGSVYNAAGELVSHLEAAPLGLRWQLPRETAPGIYLAVLGMDDGARRLRRQVVKVCLVR